MAQIIPMEMSEPTARKLIREIAADSNNIVLVPHAKKRGAQRNIALRQIVECVRKGTILEGPFLNLHGHWQVTLTRLAAGEEITCVVAIDSATKLLVITVF